MCMFRYVREEKSESEKPEKLLNALELEEWFVDPTTQGVVIAFGDVVIYRGSWNDDRRKVWIEPRSSDLAVIYKEINGHRGEGHMIVYVFYDGVWHELQVPSGGDQQ